MKVKVIVTPVLITRVEPDDVEEMLQAWLDDNPNARIEQVAQTPLTGFDGETRRLLVTIFYRD
jgi:predicted secreted protein